MKSIIISIIQILFLVSPVSASERETDYIVTFYPESGSILQNISCKIVFTAEGIDKKKISITGVIINERGDTVQSVKTLLPGIGYFHIYANPGERYILKCENRDRIRKNFYLPMMSENGFGLKIIENKEQWLLSVINSSREVPMKLLYLVAQSEDSIFFQKVWNPKDSYLVFDKKHFPKVISFLQLSKQSAISHRATASKFSKVVICIRSFLQILYHSITTKVVAINIQVSEAVIQDVFPYHSSITSLSLLKHEVFIIQLTINILHSFTFEKAYKIIE